jgi:hypothetical protein
VQIVPLKATAPLERGCIRSFVEVVGVVGNVNRRNGEDVVH